MVTTCRCLPGNVLQRCTSRTTVLPYWWLSMATVLSSTPWWTWRILYAGAVLTMAAAAFACAHSYNTAETPIAAGRPDEADLQAAEDFGRRGEKNCLRETFRSSTPPTCRTSFRPRHPWRSSWLFSVPSGFNRLSLRKACSGFGPRFVCRVWYLRQCLSRRSCSGGSFGRCPYQVLVYRQGEGREEIQKRIGQHLRWGAILKHQ